MKLSRTFALGAAVGLALVAPVAAFALDDAGKGHSAAHRSAQATDDAGDDLGEAADPSGPAGPDHATGRDRATEASAAGRAHAADMKVWAHCVAEAASGPKSGERTGPPKDACDDKPISPGRAKHAGAPAHGKAGVHHQKHTS